MVLACASAAVDLTAQTAAPRASGPLQGATRGQDALDRLGAGLGDVARRNGMAATELRRLLLSDETLWVDASQRLFFVDPSEPAGISRRELELESEGSEDAEDGSNPGAFLLHSRPNADRIIYLDFDGHHSVNNAWGHNIQFPAYDVNGNAAVFTTTELDNIIAHWKHIAEDFAPFEVDVTTEEPPLHRLRKTGSEDTQWGVRCVFTQRTRGFGNGIGGVAFLNSFDDRIDNPVFVFNKKNNNGGMTGSHEVGHALGLVHDGLGNQTYHPGTGRGDTSWGPIMGAPFGKKLVQWSPGDYAGSTSRQNDVNVITKAANGVTFKLDDHPDVLGAGTPVDVDCPVPQTASIAGLIETRLDVDTFEITSVGGYYRIEADHAPVGRNLDILLEVYDASGTLVASDNPLDEADANLRLFLPAGDYSVRIDGTEKPGVYSDYGCLGVYTLTFVPETGFVDLGYGLPGTRTPVLSGQGFACLGELVTLGVTGGWPDSVAFLFYTTEKGNHPLFGGTIFPGVYGPIGDARILPTNGAGAASISHPWPAGVPQRHELRLPVLAPGPGRPRGLVGDQRPRDQGAVGGRRATGGDWLTRPPAPGPSPAARHRRR